MKSHLRFRFLGVLVLVAAISLATTTYSMLAAQRRTLDGHVINLAGAQRMLTQRITKEALLLAQGSDKTALPILIERFDSVLLGLTEGSAALGLPPCEEPPAACRQLEVVRGLWEPFQLDLERFLSDPRRESEALKRIVASNEDLLREMNAAVEIFDEHNRWAFDRVVASQIVSLGLVLTIFVLSALFVFKPVIRRIENLVVALQASTENTTAMAEQLTAASDSILQTARLEGDSITTVASHLERVRTEAEENAADSQAVRLRVEETKINVEGGSESIATIAKTMASVVAATQRLAAIAEAARKFAFQTHILSLSAAVEAAHLGPAGAGFAAIATRVRELAQSSDRSAQNSSETIELSTDRVENVHRVVLELVENFPAVHNRMIDITQRISRVASSTEAQLDSLNSIRHPMEDLRRMASEGLRHADRARWLSERLSEHTAQLKELTAELQKIADPAARRPS